MIWEDEGKIFASFISFLRTKLIDFDIDSSNKEAKTTKNLNKKSSSHVSHKSKKSNYLGYLKKILPHQK